MGTWGIGIFDDDFAMDIKDAFEEAINSGENIKIFSSELLSNFEEDCDEEDRVTLFLALATLQLKYNALQDYVRKVTLEIIKDEQGKDLWEEAGLWDQRRKILMDLHKQLLKY
jgi:hypothetical protein